MHNLILSASNRRACEHNNERRQGHRARVSPALMYEMRYRLFIDRWSIEKVAAHYRIDKCYVSVKVFDYHTMSSIVPRKDVKPEDFESLKWGRKR